MMIYDWTRKHAEKNPRHIAISHSNRHLSYGRLESESNRLAGLLLSSGLQTGDRVGLLMENIPEAVVAMLGINKAGGVFVPMNVSDSITSHQSIIIRSKMKFLMVDPYGLPSCRSLLQDKNQNQGLRWIWWSRQQGTAALKECCFSMADLSGQSDLPYQTERNEDQPAYILFHSTSGGPKGVVTTHKNLTAFLSWAVPFFNMKPGDRISGYSSLSEDLSIFDIFGTLASGSHLYQVPPGDRMSPNRIADFILENDITQWTSHPGILNYLSHHSAIPSYGFPGLRRVIWSGGLCRVPTLTYFRQQLPNVSLTHLHGVKESTIASSAHAIREIPDSNCLIPAGIPCAGDQFLVLDESLEPVPVGTTGVLYVKGPGLSPGYWRDKDATNSRFQLLTYTDGKRERIFRTDKMATVTEDGTCLIHHRKAARLEYQEELEMIEVSQNRGNMLQRYIRTIDLRTTTEPFRNEN